MSKLNFPQILIDYLAFVGGYVGSNSLAANRLYTALETLTPEELKAWLEYKSAFTSTKVLREGFGTNVRRLR